jgi:hypothetical protein
VCVLGGMRLNKPWRSVPSFEAVDHSRVLRVKVIHLFLVEVGVTSPAVACRAVNSFTQ